MPKTAPPSINVAEAKRRFSDLLGRVAYGGETVLITRRGRAMAKLVPVGTAGGELGIRSVRGWLEDSDPFFAAIDSIIAARGQHRPRAYAHRRKTKR